MYSPDTIKKEAEGLSAYSVSLRRYFHENPEIAKEEFNTAKKIEEELHAMGLETERVGGTGVYSEIKGWGKGKTIVLRADIDALPIQEERECPYKSRIEGRMHACGHDAHAATLLTAARILSAHADLFPGTVRLVFQCGEEIGYGARIFADEGYLDGADRCYSSHVSSDIEVGKISATSGPNNASVDWFRISVKGRGCHVASPEKGADALYIASQIVVSAQALITRLTNPADSVLIGIGKLEAGTAYNVVASSASLEGTIRAMSAEERRNAKENLEKLSKNIAETFGGEVSFSWKDFTSPLVNAEGPTKEVRKTAAKLIGEENIITNRRYSLGGDDYAEFILKVPGMYAYIGSANKDRAETRLAHHDSSFDIDERCLTIGAELYALYALDFLNGNI